MTIYPFQASLYSSCRRRSRHAPDLQVLNDDHLVVLADGARGLVQVITAGVGDATVDAGLTAEAALRT